jgi:phosphoribosylanthranilate isomerase
MVLVKICGHTSRKDAEKAIALGADLVGVIVEVPVDTPRKVTVEKAKHIFSAVAEGRVMVIMPSSVEEARRLCLEVMPDYVQLHGRESIALIKELRRVLPYRIIKTIHVAGREAIKEALGYAPYCDYLLLDTPSTAMGGSGKKHDWSISRAIVRSAKVPVILAGGLNPGNVREAIRTVEPYAVDVSSGVEATPGRKDYRKVKDFIAAAKGA